MASSPPSPGAQSPDGSTTGDDRPAASEPHAAPTARSRAGLVAVVVGGLLVAALVLVVTQRNPAALPPGSPEATVQAFLQSMVDDEPDTSLLVAGACGTPQDSLGGEERLRIVVDDITIDGDTAQVDLTVTETSGSGMFDGGSGHTDAYWLERTTDGWRISAFTWPWDDCWNTRKGG